MSTISKLLVGLGIDAGEYNTGLDEAEKKAGTSAAAIGSKLASVGSKILLAGGAAAITAVTGTVVSGVNAFQDWADIVDSMGDVLGTSAEESTALAVAIQGIGGNVEGITSQMAFMARGLIDAKGELGTTGQVLDSLGINFRDANGNMLPTSSILSAVADKLSAMPDGLEKTSLMTSLFGKSGKDLSDTLNALANGGMANAAQKASDLGLMLSDTTVNASIEAGKQVETLKMGWQGFLVTVGSQLIPILIPFLTMLTSWAREIMPQVVAGVTSAATWIQSSLIPAIQQIIPVVQEWLAKLQPIGEFLLNNWQPILIGIGTIIGVFLVAAFVSWATAAATAAVTTIAAMSPVIPIIVLVGAIVAAFALAWKNDWGGIQEKTQAVISFVRNLIQTGMEFIHNLTSGKMGAISTIWTNTWNLIKTTVQNVITIIKTIVEAFQAAFHGDWYTFGEKLRVVWDTLWQTITTIVKTAWENLKIIVSELVTNIVKFFTDTDWGEVGRNIVQGIANGITNAVDWIIRAAEGVGSAALDAIKGFLGIQSPSAVMESQVGWQMGMGVQSGWMKSMESMRTSALAGIKPLTSNLSTAAVNSQMSSIGGTQKTEAGPTIVVPYQPMFANADDYEIARRLAPSIRRVLREQGIN